VVDMHHAPGMTTHTANLLQYSSPNGPFHTLVGDSSDGFTYTVPVDTPDFIYLNFGSINKGMVVTWCCTAAVSVKRCDTANSGRR
jgi:hypothetical protein